MKKNSTKEFEDNRWQDNKQKLVYRHVQALELVEGPRVLDIGCGDGLLLSILKNDGIEPVGVDLSEEAVKKCKEKNIEAFVVDTTQDGLHFSDNDFDTVVLLDVLEHLYAPENVLKEAVRVSKKNLIIGVPNFNSLPARLQVLFGLVPENNKPNKGHLYWFNYDVLLLLTRDAGLHLVEMRTNTIWEKYFLIGDIMKFFVKLCPSMFALSFVLKLRK